MEQLVRQGDFDQAARALADLRGQTHRAASATDGPLWNLGRHLPLLGDDIGATQTAASVLDAVTRDNAPVALRLSRAVDAGALRPRHGRIDLPAIRRLTPDVREAAAALRTQRARLDGIDLTALSFPFGEVVRELVGQVDRADGAASATARAFDLLPRMLGARGQRNYLLLVQNNAELRSTGGIPGSIAVLHADRGRVTMGLQGSAADLVAGRVVAPMARDALRIYGPTMLTDPRDVTFNPDFPAVARVTAAMLEASQGIRVDGVLSIDPVALSYLLAGTGPVQVSYDGQVGRLGSGTVVPTLLHSVYQALPDPAAQDAYFEVAARAIFDAVMAGQGNVRQAVTGLATGAGQHRVLVWSRHPAEQRVLDGTAVGGALPADARDPDPQVGVYLTDAVAGKADFFLDYQPTVSARGCRPDGRQQLDLSVALSSSMTRRYEALSDWVTGDGTYAPKGTIAVNVRLYGPVAGSVTSVRVGGRPLSVTVDRQAGRQVAVVPVELRPGQRVVVRARMVTGPGQSGSPQLSFTPGIRNQPNGVRTTSACG